MISVTYNHSYGYWDHCQKGIFSADWGWTQSVNSVILVAWPRGKCLGQLLLDLLQLVWQYHNLLVLLLMRFNWIVRVRNSWEINFRCVYISKAVWNNSFLIGVGSARSTLHGDIICARYSPRGAGGSSADFRENIPPITGTCHPCLSPLFPYVLKSSTLEITEIFESLTSSPFSFTNWKWLPCSSCHIFLTAHVYM